MYSGPLCNFCDAAKRLFLRNNLEFKEIDISTKEELRDEMIKKSNGRRTIPQIFIDDYQLVIQHISLDNASLTPDRGVCDACPIYKINASCPEED